MKFFTEIMQFRSDYQVTCLSILKLFMLYPIFRLRFWFYHGSAIQRKIATFIFEMIPKNFYFKIKGFSSVHQKHFSIPLWLIPDHLTSFREIFLYHGYKLENKWKPRVMVDAGANLGYTSLYLSIFHPLKRILAIEANQELYPRIKIVGKFIKELNVDFFLAEGALTGNTRTLIFNIAENSRDSGLDNNSINSKKVEVQGKTFQDWIRFINFPPIDSMEQSILKIDIEGAEYEIQKLDPSFFNQFQFLIAEIHGEKNSRDLFIEELGPNLSILKRIILPDCHIAEVSYFEKKI